MYNITCDRNEANFTFEKAGLDPFIKPVASPPHMQGPCQSLFEIATFIKFFYDGACLFCSNVLYYPAQ